MNALKNKVQLIGNAGSDPEIKIFEAGKKLVQLAIKDAKENAENIATTLGVKLKGIKSVSKFNGDYGYKKTLEEVKYKPLAAAAVGMDSPSTSFSKYEVEDKELEEDITIVYEIGK